MPKRKIAVSTPIDPKTLKILRQIQTALAPQDSSITELNPNKLEDATVILFRGIQAGKVDDAGNLSLTIED